VQLSMILFLHEVSGKNVSKRRLNNELCISESQCPPEKKLRKHSLASSAYSLPVISQRFVQEPLLLKCTLSSNSLTGKTRLQTNPPFSVLPEVVKSLFINPKPLFHLTTALNTSCISVVPSEQCPWQLLLELRQLLLLTLSSSAVSVLSFGVVLPGPEQGQRRF